MKKNKIFLYLSWGWLILVIIASFVPRPQSIVRQLLRKMLRLVSKGDIDKQVHLLFYFIMVFLFCLAYKNNKVRFVIVAIAIFISGVVEYLQPILSHGSRRTDKIDLLYNISGCFLGLIAATFIEFFISKFREIKQIA